MKVKAKHWLKHNGVWYRGGDVFEIPTTDADELKGMVDIAETPIEDAAEPAVEAPKKRGGRPRKAAE